MTRVVLLKRSVLCRGRSGRVCELQPLRTNKGKQVLPNREFPFSQGDIVRNRTPHLILSISLPRPLASRKLRLFLPNISNFSLCDKSWIPTLQADGDSLSVSETRVRSRTSPKVGLSPLSAPSKSLIA